jgi:hypothetical protein
MVFFLLSEDEYLSIRAEKIEKNKVATVE